GRPVASTQAIYQAVSTAKANGLTFTVTRGGLPKDLFFVPEGTEAKNGPGLVFALPTFPARGLAPGQAIAEGWTKTWSLFAQMVQGLGQLFTGRTNVADSLSGPLRITYYVGEVASQGFLAGWGQGWGAAANFLAFISLAVFLMNLLPIPALDGGSIVISIVEVFRHRRIGAKALMRYQQVGMVLVLGLVLFTTFNDLGFLFGPK
ncbi:MAG TPA: site-2 protease family protein, partial [Spirochaetia bacterium]|nr:site-2 protease family protein [Spirochaetia bacterium]